MGPLPEFWAVQGVPGQGLWPSSASGSSRCWPGLWPPARSTPRPGYLLSQAQGIHCVHCTSPTEMGLPRPCSGQEASWCAPPESQTRKRSECYCHYSILLGCSRRGLLSERLVALKRGWKASLKGLIPIPSLLPPRPFHEVWSPEIITLVLFFFLYWRTVAGYQSLRKP